MNDRERTAYHEAGHAVAMALLYDEHTLSSVTISPNPEAGAAGVCYASERGLRFPRSLWRGNITKCIYTRRLVEAAGVYSYAGIAAERELLVPDYSRAVTDDLIAELGVFFWLAWQGAKSDMLGLEEFAQSFGAQRPAHRWHSSSWSRARRLLDENWPAVEAVAAELLARQTVPGSWVQGIVLEGRERDAASPVRGTG